MWGEIYLKIENTIPGELECPPPARGHFRSADARESDLSLAGQWRRCQQTRSPKFPDCLSRANNRPIAVSGDTNVLC
jgi:hypothetical protein